MESGVEIFLKHFVHFAAFFVVCMHWVRLYIHAVDALLVCM